MNQKPNAMTLLFEYIEALETRVKVLEEEYDRYDFGYDPAETLLRRIQAKIQDNSNTCSQLKLDSEKNVKNNSSNSTTS